MRLILLLFTALAGFGQDYYVAQSAADTKFTIQAPAAASARQITFGNVRNSTGATVYCAAAQTATYSWNGTAASSTAGTETKLPGTFAASGATLWTGSNVGSGTTGPITYVPAGATVALDMTPFKLGTGGNTSNITIATSGACTITFFYQAAQ